MIQIKRLPLIHGFGKFTAGALLLCMGSTASAQVPIIQPGRPGQPGRVITAEEAADLANIKYSRGDTAFLQGMISHHAQAKEMSLLAKERTHNDAVLAMADRIFKSQDDEISMMQGWLKERGLEVPSDTAHHAHGFMPMPGMLTHEEFAALEAASGPEFDRLYLEHMIKHHLGAVKMVEDLLKEQGSAQDPVLYEFTSDVTSDQNSEIKRMDALLASFSPDPRVGLAAGFRDAREASLNLKLIATLPKPDGFFDPDNPAGLPAKRLAELKAQALAPDPNPEPPKDAEATDTGSVSQAAGNPKEDEKKKEDEKANPRPSLLSFANTDLLFAGDYLVAGNYHGFNAYDIKNPTAPKLVSSVVCPGGQGDVSLVGNLLIMSVQEARGRLDCGLVGVPEPVSKEDRIRGIRIFDVRDFTRPRQVGAVQTCRGSHTHTVASQPNRDGKFYVYVSGTGGVRDDKELAGCSDDSPFENRESALFRIEVIEIPYANPRQAKIVNRPFIFADPASGKLAGLWRGGDHGEGTQSTSETSQCHDITAFPEIGRAAGACSGNGILLNISDPVNPKRLDQVVDPSFAYWHSATFNNRGDKVIFTDEWGGGSRPRCRAQDKRTWGADAFYDIINGKMQFRSHYKMPAPQSESENCVAHNGSLIPIPGRDIFVQAWYQGGISVVDFTDSSKPVEIAFFDRGPVDEKELILAGYWSAYWYRGHVFATEIARGLDVFALAPSEFISANEIAAASLPELDGIVNAQTQKIIKWPAVPVVARAYLDQLQRENAISASDAQNLTAALDAADKASSDATASQLRRLAKQFNDAADGFAGINQIRYASLAHTLEGIADKN